MYRRERDLRCCIWPPSRWWRRELRVRSRPSANQSAGGWRVASNGNAPLVPHSINTHGSMTLSRDFKIALLVLFLATYTPSLMAS